jgi:mono/diheme cytochrome c family protein
MNRSLLFATGLLLGSYCAFAQAPTPAQLQAGKTVYAKNCLFCHMVDGAGVPGLNPPLGKTDWVIGDKKRLINVVLLGLNDPITINGEEYANPMPPQPQLSDKDIADVLTYIRNSFGNKASVVTEAEVKAQRAKAGPVKPK